jgi:hypothetical protein
MAGVKKDSFEEELNSYIRLIEIFVEVIQSNAGAKGLGIYVESEDLMKKILFNSITVLNIYKFKNIKFRNGMVIDNVDFSSIHVISRAILESFLIFNWIMLDEIAEGEREYRYLLWKIYGIRLRVSFPYKSEEHIKKIEQEEASLRSKLLRLRENEFFKIKKKKEQDRIIEDIELDRMQLRPGAKRLLKIAGFENNITHIYRYLCDYSHSGSIAASQIRQATKLEDQEFLCKIPIRIVLYVLALSIQGYCKICPKSKSCLDNNPENKLLVDFWSDIGKGSW